jgi:hypothetical protein
MRRAGPALLVLVFAVVPACGSSKSPTGPDTTGSTGGAVAITGSERLGWSQPAASAEDAAALGYRLFVDASRVDVSGTACEPSTTLGVYECSAPLPRLSTGRHVLSLIAVDSRGVEGPPSLALTVIVSGS